MVIYTLLIKSEIVRQSVGMNGGGVKRFCYILVGNRTNSIYTFGFLVRVNEMKISLDSAFVSNEFYKREENLTLINGYNTMTRYFFSKQNN